MKLFQRLALVFLDIESISVLAKHSDDDKLLELIFYGSNDSIVMNRVIKNPNCPISLLKDNQTSLMFGYEARLALEGRQV